MPVRELQAQLDHLRSQLSQDMPLTDDERAELHALARDIEIRLASEQAGLTQDESLIDGVNLAVERFEVSHPGMAMTLRNIMQSLVSMGI